MRLIKPSATIMAMTPAPLLLIEAAGRTCYKSEHKIVPGSDLDFAQMIKNRGHDSVIEHASATVRFICDRGVSHEIVRHRIASYSQESTRYCDYGDGHITFIIPPWVYIPEGEYQISWEGLYGQCHMTSPFSSPEADIWFWNKAIIERDYKKLRDHGWRPEQARSILSNDLKTEIVMTANFREWYHFFKLRTAPAAHPQMREVAVPLLADFMAIVPVIFDDLVK
jgi:thymidylate synthase (FAD)